MVYQNILLLQRIFHKEKAFNIRLPKIKDVKFEQVHKIFEKRSVDLYLNVSEGEDDIDVFFEFKYIKKCQLPVNESDRYINDLFRLASLAKLSNENKKTEGFFMLVGNPTIVMRLMSSINDDSEDNSTGRCIIKPFSKPSNPDIVKCLPLEINTTINVALHDICYGDNNQQHLKRFKKLYKYRKQIDNGLKLKANDHLKVTLKYITDSKTDNIGVYIWQVEI